MIVDERLVIGRLSQDRRGILADEADDGRMCEGEVEGDVSAKPFAVQANPITELCPDVLQNFQMAAHELVHSPAAMLGHDENVEAPVSYTHLTLPTNREV